jgi:hypothetical protein
MAGIETVLQGIGSKKDAGHGRTAKKVAGSIGEAADAVCEIFVTMREEGRGICYGLTSHWEWECLAQVLAAAGRGGATP